jgi:CHASE1-domain containing sensor protein
MELLTGVLSAAIAAIVSLIIALISYLTNKNTLKSEREKFERELQRSMTSKLYDLRLEKYPEAIAITDGLRRSRMSDPGGDLSETYFKAILAKLDEWHGVQAFLLLSPNAVGKLYSLCKVLREKPEIEGKEWELNKIEIG